MIELHTVTCLLVGECNDIFDLISLLEELTWFPRVSTLVILTITQIFQMYCAKFRLHALHDCDVSLKLPLDADNAAQLR